MEDEMKCSEEGCDRDVLARGMCGMHYQRWDKKRDPERFREYDRRFLERNRERLREEARRRYLENPEKEIRLSRQRTVRRKYGLTLEEYESILAGGCSICGAHGPGMAMDHDHANGMVRDALCGNCNNGLGRFKDDPERLRAAANYLERHRKDTKES